MPDDSEKRTDNGVACHFGNMLVGLAARWIRYAFTVEAIGHVGGSYHLESPRRVVLTFAARQRLRRLSYAYRIWNLFDGLEIILT